jgi:hypothetical protein
MQAATPATANNLENLPRIEFPQRTNGPRLSHAKPLHAIVDIPLPTVQSIKPDRNAAVLFDGQMTVLAVICAKTLSFIVYLAVARLTLAISTLCSLSMRPWIEPRFPKVSRSSA